MSKHLKRLAAPTTQGIPRKVHVWIAKASPGPHPVSMSIPLIVVLRDMLRICDYADEGRKLIGARKIIVDGRVVTDPKFPLGLMDVLSLPDLKEHYRVLLDVRGRLRLVRITDKEAKWKLARIENKHVVPGKKFQLNLHDGRNILLEKNMYRSGDVIKIELPGQKTLAHYPLTDGASALLIGGKHSGELGTVTEYQIRKGTEPNIVIFKEGFFTVKDNVFVVGTGTPEIKLPEVKVL